MQQLQDRRVRRTQQLLAEALIALTLEKGYEAVTIRDITKRADVGYATFFRHYRLQAATHSTSNENIPRPDSIVPFEIAAHHIVASTITLIEWWLDHQMPYPTERMGMIYAELIARPTTEASFLPKRS